MSDAVHIVTGASLDDVWISAMEALLEPGVGRLADFTVTCALQQGAAPGRPRVQALIDSELQNMGLYLIDTTANTIFPQSLWNSSQSRDLLFQRYQKIVPALKRLDTRNRYGMYFERLIGYKSAPQSDRKPVNQLDHIITTFLRGNKRRSALQASIFNPLFDLNHQRLRGFPCMQYVSFDPGANSTLRVTAVYTTQYVFDRGYGNYLGLFRLGTFMAHEMGLDLTTVSVIAINAQIGTINKGAGRNLISQLLAAI